MSWCSKSTWINTLTSPCFAQLLVRKPWWNVVDWIQPRIIDKPGWRNSQFPLGDRFFNVLIDEIQHVDSFLLHCYTYQFHHIFGLENPLFFVGRIHEITIFHGENPWTHHVSVGFSWVAERSPAEQTSRRRKMCRSLPGHRWRRKRPGGPFLFRRILGSSSGWWWLEHGWMMTFQKHLGIIIIIIPTDDEVHHFSEGLVETTNFSHSGIMDDF